MTKLDSSARNLCGRMWSTVRYVKLLLEIKNIPRPLVNFKSRCVLNQGGNNVFYSQLSMPMLVHTPLVVHIKCIHLCQCLSLCLFPSLCICRAVPISLVYARLNKGYRGRHSLQHMEYADFSQVIFYLKFEGNCVRGDDSTGSGHPRSDKTLKTAFRLIRYYTLCNVVAPQWVHNVSCLFLYFAWSMAKPYTMWIEF